MVTPPDTPVGVPGFDGAAVFVGLSVVAGPAGGEVVDVTDGTVEVVDDAFVVVVVATVVVDAGAVVVDAGVVVVVVVRHRRATTMD